MIKHGEIVKTVRDILMRELRMSYKTFWICTQIFNYFLLLQISHKLLASKLSQKQPFVISCSQLMEAGVSGLAGHRALRRVVLSGSLATGAVLVLCQWQEGQRVQASKSSTRAWECR